jgi:hypothetical protein
MQKVGICPTSIHLWRDCMRRLFRRRMAYCDQARRRMDEKNRSTRSGGPKVCCCAGEYRARIMACSVIFHAITIGYRRKGVSPIKGGGDTRAGGLFIPGRTLESRVDLLRPVQEVGFVAPDTTLGADSNIALLPISGFSAKLLMSSRICQTTTLYRLILASDSPSKQKLKNAK